MPRSTHDDGEIGVSRWGVEVRRLFGRPARRAGEKAEAGAMREAWRGAYAILRDGRQWQAIHLGSGDVIGPVRDLGDLSVAIQADWRRRPARTK